MSKEPFNSHQWRTFAMSVQWVTFLLKNIYLDIQLNRGNTLSLLGGATSVSGNIPTDTIKLGCSLSMPVVLAHTLELTLKALRKKPPERKHNLILLYNLLDQETKEMLVVEFAQELKKTDTKHRDFEDVLAEHQDDYKKWKYPNELLSATSKTGPESWIYMEFAICSALNVYSYKHGDDAKHQGQ